MKRTNIIKSLLFLLTVGCGMQLFAQCPDIYYAKSSTRPAMVARGWDTLVTCEHPTIKIEATPFVTCQNFQSYTVESIPYAPPDTTFCSHAGGGGQLPVNQDDYYDATAMSFPFTFVFFGRRYNSAVVGPNGNVSFNSSMTGQSMPYQVNNYAPIPSSSTQSTNSVKNNIFGLWEDIDPRYFNNTGIANAGIHKAIYTIPPAHQGPECRMLVVSYKGVPKYGHSSATEAPTHYSTSQIVCYEGTNIIDVYIKRHSAACGTDGNKAVVGLLNPGGDTAYCAPGRNPIDNQDITTPEGWRFTPVGTTVRNIRWFVGDSVCDENLILSNSPADSVYRCDYDGNQYMAITVSPTVPTTYTMQLIYIGANGTPYDVRYHVRVGTNFSHNMNITYDSIVCKGELDTIHIDLQGNDLTATRRNEWHCDNPRLRFSFNSDSTTVFIPVQTSLFLPPFNNTPDFTSNFSLTTTFTNGCHDSAYVTIRHINRINDTVYGSICDDQTYSFGGHQYSQVGTYSYDTVTVEGCPYTHSLRLDAHNTNGSTDYQKDCHPITWIDGETYSETTTTPTYVLTNKWGCDSTVTLNFTFDNSLEALIEANPASATLDKLHLMLRDVSLGSKTRRWFLPNGTTDTNSTIYYDFPTSQDSITFMMVAYSPYGCQDTAFVTIPLLKQTIWFPNAFTPGREENNIFKPTGIGIVTIDVDIYDRRGQWINSFSGEDGFWDGKSSKGVDMPEGAYVYRCRHTTVIDPSNPVENRGTILLVR